MTNTVVNNNTNTGLASESFYSAITLENDARLNHCTIIHNNAPGICAMNGQLRLYNSVLWGNTSTGTIAPEDIQITGEDHYARYSQQCYPECSGRMESVE